MSVNSERKRIFHVGIAAGLLCVSLLSACGKKENSDIDVYRQYGINCLESGNYVAAIDSFQKALGESRGKLTEKELDICFYKAKAYYLNGDADSAMEVYDSIIDYNEDGRAYYLRGNLCFDLGEQERALADYEKALSGNKVSYQLYLGVYESLERYNMAEDGKKYLEQAMQLKGDKPEDHLYRGRICYLLGNYDEAVEYLKKAVDEEQTLAPYYLGQTYEALGDTANADTYIKLYLDSGAATSYDMYELGAAEMSEEDYEQALVYYNAGLAMETVPNRQSLMRCAIAAYEYSGDFSSAKSMMREYIKLYPDDEAAQKESIFLKTR